MQDESKRALWSARLREHADSGMTIRSWCALQGLTEATFHYWRKRLSASPAPVTELIAVTLPGRQAASMLELETPHGYVIRLTNESQIGWLAGILAALR
jgi:hypothetical protein